ncbi:MAG: PQQ-binding-like beta-propeller repeat protein [Chloroflexota bacterium]
MPLFCPHCQSDLADAAICPTCGQPRPEPPAVELRWTAALAAATYGTPVAAKDWLFLLTAEGAPAQHSALLAFDLATRQVRWSCRLENLLVSDPALFHGSVLYAAARSADPLGAGLLLALDADSGTERWRWAPGAQAVSAPAVTGDTLYVTLDGDQLWAVSPETGEPDWHLRLPMPRSVAAPAASPEAPRRLYLPSRGPHLCAVDVARRAIVWHHTSADDAGTWFLATPALAQGRLLAASSGGAVLALDAATGERLWRATPGRAGNPLTAPAADGQRIYAGGRDHCIYALDASSGETLWTYETARRIEGRPLILGNVLYITGHDHHLRALDAVTGRELWHIELPGRIEGGPVVCGDLVLAADQAGNVVAVAGEGPKPPDYLQIAQDHAAAGNWVEAGQAYERAGKPDLAAPALQQAGLLTRAVDNYCKAEMWAEAAYLHETQEQWTRAADCYGKANRWADAGRIQSSRLNDWAAAAESFVRAASSGAATYIAAGYWEHARHSYLQLGDRVRAEDCQREIALLRGLPHIQVKVSAPQVMILGEYDGITCEIKNAGGGTAQQVFLCHTLSEFAGDLQATIEIHNIPPGNLVHRVLYLSARAAGRRVPLDIIITYADKNARTYEVRHRQLLTVHHDRSREQNRNEGEA